MGFKQFLIHENRMYLGQKVGDILTASQELRDDSRHMGSRDLTRFSERIVSQIRRILHSHWPREERKNLLTLQKIGVAIMKAIDEKADLPTVISSAAAALEKLVGDLGVPLHKFGAPDKPDPEGQKGVAAPVKPQKQPSIPNGTVDQAGPVAPPNQQPDQFTPPLAGNSGPLAAF